MLNLLIIRTFPLQLKKYKSNIYFIDVYFSKFKTKYNEINIQLSAIKA